MGIGHRELGIEAEVYQQAMGNNHLDADHTFYCGC